MSLTPDNNVRLERRLIEDGIQANRFLPIAAVGIYLRLFGQAFQQPVITECRPMEFTIDKAGAGKMFVAIRVFVGGIYPVAGKIAVADAANMKDGVCPVPLGGDDECVVAVPSHDGVGVNFFGCLRVYEKDRERPGLVAHLV